jgi:hypothetical protein
MTSGNAPGSDQAYALGYATDPGPRQLELYLPWASFERRAIPWGAAVFTVDQATPEHHKLAEEAAVGYWHKLRPGQRPLAVRNAMIIRRFDRPVDVVWAYPQYNKIGLGGTGHACRVADLLGVPVYMIPELPQAIGVGG